LRSEDRIAQHTRYKTNVNINKLGLHAINGPYLQVGLQCRNKQTNKQCSHLVPITDLRYAKNSGRYKVFQLSSIVRAVFCYSTATNISYQQYNNSTFITSARM